MLPIFVILTTTRLVLLYILIKTSQVFNMTASLALMTMTFILPVKLTAKHCFRFASCSEVLSCLQQISLISWVKTLIANFP